MPGSVVRPPGGKIIKPGPDLIQAARPLQTIRRGFGQYPYQWMFPGPNAKNVNAIGSILVPDPPAGASDIVSYQVAEGMRFSCRGLAVGVKTPDPTAFNAGIGDSIFTLVVRTSAGNRNVDYFQNFSIPLGSSDAPWPVIGPLEFDSLDTLVWIAQNNATPSGAGLNAYFAIIAGFEYPLTEALL
jgi:hypothetical protein